MIIDHELRFRFVNDVAAEINGLSASDHIGARLDEVPLGTAEEAGAMLRRVLDTGEATLGQEIVGEDTALIAVPVPVSSLDVTTGV